MSFISYKPTVESGDTVLLYLGHYNTLPLKVEVGKTHQTRYGAVKHNDLIGAEYGSKVHASKGWLFVLHVTPELWTLNLPHRTQILYSTDISMVTLQLELKPGAIVVESGTGSGSLSHAILRTIAPSGKLYTFDFHAQRVEKAIEEFKEHGVSHLVTATCKDVCKEGYDLEDVADAVFLDLPSPWDVLPHARKVLKKSGGRLCSFSPCIEQVQRACDKMAELGFLEITTMECLLRTFDVRTAKMPLADLGGEVDGDSACNSSSSFVNPTIGNIQKCVATKPTVIENKEEMICDQAQALCSSGNSGEVPSSPVDSAECRNKPNDKQDEEYIMKKPRMDNESAAENLQSVDSEFYVFKTGLAPNEMPGHTGYLTFATLFPSNT